MIHGLITLIICLVIFKFNLPSVLYSVPAGFYLGREFAQAEYRIIRSRYFGKRENMPWYGPFLAEAWDLKSNIDWSLPLVISLFFIIFISHV